MLKFRVICAANGIVLFDFCIIDFFQDSHQFLFEVKVMSP